MKVRKGRKRGRKHRALQCLLWIVILLMVNTVFHGIPLFHFQARENMEVRYGWEKMDVVWEETADRGWWDGTFHCLSANANVAVFYSMYNHLSGWYNEVIQILNKNTTKVIDAAWSNQYDADHHTILWLMGYVASEQVACIEYTLIWSGDIAKTYLISEKDFLWDGTDCYYVYDTGEVMFMKDSESGEDEVMISDVIVIARNEAGEILYQEYLFPSWKGRLE